MATPVTAIDERCSSIMLHIYVFPQVAWVSVDSVAATCLTIEAWDFVVVLLNVQITG